jgi:hypothetical protein
VRLLVFVIVLSLGLLPPAAPAFAAPAADGGGASVLRDAQSDSLGSLLPPEGARLLRPADGGPIQARPSRSSLAERLALHPELFQYGPDGGIEAVFGVPRSEACSVFFPVSQTRAIPDAYVPTDLVDDFDHPVRAVIAGSLAAMFQAAERAGAYPEVVSGYRSAEYQAVVFQQSLQRQLFRADPTDRDEAERRASRFVARPGHSQHQLGTTVDLSSGEIDYTLRASFAETVAGRWLAEHAWEYGFIQPYTSAAESRSGYAAESWHYRWVGRPLAAQLWQDGYLTSGYPTADDVLLALEELLIPIAP